MRPFHLLPRWFFGLMALLILVACGQSTPVMFTETLSQAATPLLSLTSSPLPPPTQTVTPTFLPTSTPTPLPTFTPTLVPPEIILNGLLDAAGETRTAIYVLTVEPESDIKVTGIFTGLQGPSIRFDFAPDVYFGGSLKSNIVNFAAQTLDGKELPVVSEGYGWRVTTLNQSTIQVQYLVGNGLHVQPDAFDYFVQVTADGAFFYHQSVLAYPNIQPVQAFVIYDVPPGWVVGTSYTPMGNHTYRVEGPGDLKTNLLLNISRAGIASHVRTLACDDVTLSFIAYPLSHQDEIFAGLITQDYPTRMDEYLNLTCEAIRYYRDVTGRWSGSKDYWTSTSAVVGEYVTKYWAYWMQTWGPPRYNSLIHHVLHAYIWNPIMGPSFLDYSGQDSWFGEGVPTFYEAVLTEKLTGDAIWWGATYTNYLSMKRAAQFKELAFRDYIITYAYGQMRALALDLEIRRLTDGEKSFDDLLHLLAERYGGTGKPFGRAEILTALKDVTGQDMSAFYLRYLAGYVSSELPPVDEFMLAYSGEFLRWLEQYSQSLWGENAIWSKTVVLLALEVGIHRDEGKTTHWIYGGAGIDLLPNLCSDLQKTAPFADEIAFEDALTAITGVNESDFFEFYTMDNFQPGVDDINQWLAVCNGSVTITLDDIAITLDDIAITLDGVEDDWPSLPPVQEDGKDSPRYDMASIYLFADEKYIYLRVDPHSPFDITKPAQFTVDLITQNQEYFQLSFSTDDPTRMVHLIPSANGDLLFDQQIIYSGAAIDQVIEVVIPLASLNQPSSIHVNMYIIPTYQAPIYDQISPFTWQIKP